MRTYVRACVRACVCIMLVYIHCIALCSQLLELIASQLHYLNYDICQMLFPLYSMFVLRLRDSERLSNKKFIT